MVVNPRPWMKALVVCLYIALPAAPALGVDMDLYEEADAFFWLQRAAANAPAMNPFPRKTTGLHTLAASHDLEQQLELRSLLKRAWADDASWRKAMLGQDEEGNTIAHLLAKTARESYDPAIGVATLRTLEQFLRLAPPQEFTRLVQMSNDRGFTVPLLLNSSTDFANWQVRQLANDVRKGILARDAKVQRRY